MEDYTVSGIALVIVGVLLIVIGGGTAFAGMNKMDAEEDWEKSNTESHCYTYVNSDIDVENDSEEEIEQKMREGRERECFELQPQENPYSGGEQDITIGIGIAIIGGVSTYFGNKR
ncbi:hypothetical protein [Natrinema hispanicum]|uniref:Uncharacterized protein n=1 Tax=Natrinema hispanicum TaxID=392421 RepID=A0A1I0HKH8_9EURY|nr:hypothetical protein [Natrinema hispanicum]SET84461.1 hypothetical protein SAMN04488694_11428 [Natrinema hispanicum]